MNNNTTTTVFLAFSMLVFVGLLLVPSYAQISGNVVINEIDINPIGDDSTTITEWVELYNPTDKDVDIGGWAIASTTVLKKTLIIPLGTVIKPGEFLKYSYEAVWFTDQDEIVELRDKNSVVVDKTPVLSDIKNDSTSWQRHYDGYDSDSVTDWKFVPSTTGHSNGKQATTTASENVTVTVLSSMSSYTFGQDAVITGSVSEKVHTDKPFFHPESISVSISGPDFQKTVTLFPDYNLNFKTKLSLQQVLGIGKGTYDVIVTYADQTAQTSFYVGFEASQNKDVSDDGEFTIKTDRSQYIPGQTVTIVASATETIDFAGMKFTVTDSSGKLIESGNLYPVDGKFHTNLFITTVDPKYGTYRILAEYSGKSSSTTFKVVKDVKEDVPISLWTNSDAYGLGEIVQITGRVNNVWTSTLDLQIVQTKQSAILQSSSDAGFKILDGVQVDGDGFFTYSFEIPDSPNRLGDYKIDVSKDIGAAEIVIHVVENTDQFVASVIPLSLKSDRNVYEIGDKVLLSGFVLEPYSNSSYLTGASVKITINDQNGNPLSIIGLAEGRRTLATGGIPVSYDFTAVPEVSGNFALSIPITPSIFVEGKYVVKAQYEKNTEKNTVSIPITIINSLDIDKHIITIDKEVYGLGQRVSLTGVTPPTATQGVDITLTKPDGTVSKSGAVIDNQRFSWSWTTPVSEKKQSSKVDEDERDAIKSNLGVYKLRVFIDNYNEELSFKVSENPETDSLIAEPISVSTEKSLYKAGEKLKVVGSVIERESGSEGLVVPERVIITVNDDVFPFKEIHRSKVYPNQGGYFTSLFELPAGIFAEGSYTVKALYEKTSVTAQFNVTNTIKFGVAEDASISVFTDKTQYSPGDVVTITGMPNKIIIIEKFEVSVVQQHADNGINCGTFICGVPDGTRTLIHPRQDGSFTHEFTIPEKDSAVGTYVVTVDAGFEVKIIKFVVVDKSALSKSNTVVVDKSALSKSNTVIEKVNRIAEIVIPVLTEEKTVDGTAIAPRVFSGSLVIPIKVNESKVNLRVSAVNGTCIIGPDTDCLVQESTRKPGQIYDVVKVGDSDLSVRYSGPDVRLEKFSILSATPGEFLPFDNWNVEVVKANDEVSRFYYKVTYKTLE